VPCSNTGVMARRVELRHLLRPAGLKNLVKIQLALLEKAAAWLKPGGKLLYSTCSIDPAENQRLIEQFIGQHPAFRIVSQRLSWPCYPVNLLKPQSGGEPADDRAGDLSAAHHQLLCQLQAPPGIAHDGGFLTLLEQF